MCVFPVMSWLDCPELWKTYQSFSLFSTELIHLHSSFQRRIANYNVPTCKTSTSSIASIQPADREPLGAFSYFTVHCIPAPPVARVHFLYVPPPLRSAVESRPRRRDKEAGVTARPSASGRRVPEAPTSRPRGTAEPHKSNTCAHKDGEKEINKISAKD